MSDALVGEYGPDQGPEPPMDLAELAEQNTDIVRTAEAEGQPYMLKSFEMLDADEVGNDEFPEFGWFLDVIALDANGDELGPRYVETPRDLADELVDIGVTAGDAFVMTSCTKTEDGAWSTTAEHWNGMRDSHS